MKTVYYDLKASFGAITIIFALVLWFSFTGFFIFRGTLEGIGTFSDISVSYYNMMILLTTANYPDVMLPAYNVRRLNSIFFMLFLTLGLYFLLNVLLAIVFNNFKSKVEQESERREH
jgi:two pore calcium channel protein